MLIEWAYDLAGWQLSGGAGWLAEHYDMDAKPERPVSRGAPGHIVSQNVRMPRFAWFLKTQVNRAMVDETGLTGNYDFKLDWVPDELSARDTSGPNLFTALREQLGLKLESGRGPVEFFVIDRVEKPAEK